MDKATFELSMNEIDARMESNILRAKEKLALESMIKMKVVQFNVELLTLKMKAHIPHEMNLLSKREQLEILDRQISKVLLAGLGVRKVFRKQMTKTFSIKYILERIKIFRLNILLKRMTNKRNDLKFSILINN